MYQAKSGSSLLKDYESQIREVRMHWREARGPCWARHLAQVHILESALLHRLDLVKALGH
jgi:hypothetical protein